MYAEITTDPVLTDTIFNLPVSIPRKAQILVKKLVGPSFE